MAAEVSKNKAHCRVESGVVMAFNGFSYPLDSNAGAENRVWSKKNYVTFKNSQSASFCNKTKRGGGGVVLVYTHTLADIM